jgi:uncharacterized YigZ family protein
MVNTDTYRTLARPGEGVYREKGSKFLGFAYPVNSEAEVKAYIEAIKKQYHDARHHCYAYVLAAAVEPFMRANDDGEPAHSAGTPILNQIRSMELLNVLVIVVRYFGGIKLGVPGLIHAYRTAAQAALVDGGITERLREVFFTIDYDYQETSQVMRLLNQLHARLAEQDFQSRCRARIAVPLSRQVEASAQLQAWIVS